MDLSILSLHLIIWIFIIIIINSVLIKVTLSCQRHYRGSYKIKQNKKTKGQKRRQSVVAGRQQLYCDTVQYNHDRITRTCVLSVCLLTLLSCLFMCVQGFESTRSSQNTTVVFNGSKKEQFSPTNGFKSLHRKLKTNWKVSV